MMQHDLQVADVSALDRHQPVEQGRRDQLLARPAAPAAGRGAVRRHPPGDRLDEPAAGPAGRARGRPSCSTPTQDVPGGFLDLFGKPPRESACECERSGSMMLGPVLNLVNGPVVGDAIKDPNNRIAKLLADREGRRQGRRGIVPGVLCRLPTPTEMNGGAQGVPGRRGGLRRRRRGTRQARRRAGRLREDAGRPAGAVGKGSARPAPVWTVAGRGERQVRRAARR